MDGLRMVIFSVELALGEMVVGERGGRWVGGEG